MDLIFPDGSTKGSVATRLMQYHGDPGALRPWFNPDDGKSYITVNTGRINKATNKPVYQNIVSNAAATLTREEWVLLDREIIQIARARLQAWADLMDRGLRRDIPNGLAKTVIQYQTTTDVNGATISMDGLRESDRDRPQYDIGNLPLPIIHKDFSFSAREILVSRQSAFTMGGGTASLDMTMGELSARKVGEEVEKLLLGLSATYSYGGGTIYGYTNYPNRVTKSMTAPTGTNPYATLADVLAMQQLSRAMYRFGPWVLYMSTDWSPYLDSDYVVSGGTVTAGTTLRERLGKLDRIIDIVTLDYLPAKTAILVQMSRDVVQGIIGMPITTVDWESHGGMQMNFKVMTIMVPQLRSDANNSSGIIHGSYT